MTKIYKMFLLASFFWLCLFNSLLAYPLKYHKHSDFQPGIWAGLADYPDLTRGLTDAEVSDTLNDLTLDDLKSLDHLINEHITQREAAYKASLRAHNKNFRAVGSKSDNRCQEEHESDEPKPPSRCKPPTCPTTKRCMKITTPTTCEPKTTTCAPKTTRTTKLDCIPKTSACVPKTTTCTPKTTNCGSLDIFAKCPRLNKRRKKSKGDNEWESDEFQGQPRKPVEKGKNIFQELDLPGDALAKYAPARDLAGIEKIGAEVIPSLNDQGEPIDEAFHLDYPKESRLMEPAQLHDNLTKRKPEPLANLQGRHHASLKEQHQSHFKQPNHKLQHETNLKLGQEVNLKQNPKANVQNVNVNDIMQDLWANSDPANWDDLEQTESDRIKLATWAHLNPASLANIEDANWDLSNWVTEEQGHRPQLVPEQNNFEQGKHANFQPAQEKQAAFQMGNHHQNLKDNQAKLEQRNQAPSEHENRANFQLQNQASFDQTHRTRLVRDHHQADLKRDQHRHQNRELRSEANLQPSGQQVSRKRNAKQKSQAFIPHREQQSDVTYHPRQWSSNQQLTNQEKLNKVEGKPAPLESYKGQLSRKRNAEQESLAFIPHREQHSDVNYHPRQWSSNEHLTNQEKLINDEGKPAQLELHEEQLSRKRNAEQESLAFIPHREQHSDVNYHPRQLSSNQQLTNQEKLNKVEGEPTPLELYEQQLSRKRNAEQEKSSIPHREQKLSVNYQPRQWSSNEHLTNHEKLINVEGKPAPLELYEGQLSRKRNSKQERKSFIPHREQQSDVNYQQLSSNQPLTNHEKLNKVEGEPAPLESYKGQLSRKRNAEQESLAFIPHREQQSDGKYHPRQLFSNQQLTNQEKLINIEGKPTPLELYERQLSRKRNVQQESQASVPQGGIYKEQQSDVNYHPTQLSSNQHLINQEKLNNVEGEPAPLEGYKGQLYRKRNAEQESLSFIPHREQQSNVNYHPRQWSSNEHLTNEEKLNKVEGERYEGHQLSRKRNPGQESQASVPQGETYREQRSEVKYHPRPEQLPSHQPLTDQANLDKIEGEPLDLYGAHQLYQKRNAKLEKPFEKRRASVQEKEQVAVTKNDEPQPVNADLTKQGSHFDVDKFLANSARDPPLYLSSMQNDRVQRENERRLNKDRMLSESLNLDKLTGEKVASSSEESEWAADNKRGKRENRSTDDESPENSKETYLKKLMESFPRDQGSQINSNVALQDSPFTHERMKRS